MFRVFFLILFHYYYYTEPKIFIVHYRKVFVLNADLDVSFCHFDGSLTTSVVIKYIDIFTVFPSENAPLERLISTAV